MFEKFFPDIFVDKFIDITPKLLSDKRISAVILDIDNTLVHYDVEEPTEEVMNWIYSLQEMGIKACILSNAKKPRVEKFNEKLGLNYIYKAGKPSIKGYLKAAELMHVQPYQTAVIGDQIFTDIYGGKRSSMLSILVKPISLIEIWPIRLKRLLEGFILYRYKKSGLGRSSVMKSK